MPARAERALGPRHALRGAGAVLLLCALLATWLHPEPPPELAALERSDGVSSSVGEGRQFCGPPGKALGHAGAWVIELWIAGREHCVLAYPKSEREGQAFSSLPPRPKLTAWHTASTVWQVAGPGGMLVDYATRRAEAEAALGHQRKLRAVLLAAGLASSVGGWAMGRRTQRRARTRPSAR